jgi:hypothetical protein
MLDRLIGRGVLLPDNSISDPENGSILVTAPVTPTPKPSQAKPLKTQRSVVPPYRPEPRNIVDDGGVTSAGLVQEDALIECAATLDLPRHGGVGLGEEVTLSSTLPLGPALSPFPCEDETPPQGRPGLTLATGQEATDMRLDLIEFGRAVRSSPVIKWRVPVAPLIGCSSTEAPATCGMRIMTHEERVMAKLELVHLGQRIAVLEEQMASGRWHWAARLNVNMGVRQ